MFAWTHQLNTNYQRGDVKCNLTEFTVRCNENVTACLFLRLGTSLPLTGTALTADANCIADTNSSIQQHHAAYFRSMHRRATKGMATTDALSTKV